MEVVGGGGCCLGYWGGGRGVKGEVMWSKWWGRGAERMGGGKGLSVSDQIQRGLMWECWHGEVVI